MKTSLGCGFLVFVFAAIACGGGESDAPAAGGPTVEGVVAPDETIGVFVSPNAGRDGTGTRAAPYRSIADAINSAHGQGKGKTVYACAGTFAEAIVLTEGISLFGNYDCDSWTAVDRRAQIVAPTSPAVRANRITTATTFSGFDVLAPEGSAGAPSSIALIAVGSDGLRVVNASLTSKNAANGIDGTESFALTRQDGNGAPSIPEGPCPKEVLCFATHGQIVLGGTATCHGPQGHLPDFDPQKGGAGGSSGIYKALCLVVGEPNKCSWTPRDSASDAATKGEQVEPQKDLDGKGGVSAAAGTFSADGYTPGDGTPGENGKPGYGGSGGDGAAPIATVSSPTEQRMGTAGGSGGAGGCPGLAGTHGTGGGASVGALLLSSAVTFERVNVTSGNGGNGGKGTLGSAPTEGGMGGFGAGTAAGQPGGRGGASGVSGSGSGGPSIGIASRDGTPKLVETIAVAGKGGEGVLEMIGEGGKTLPASPSGIAEGSYVLTSP